MRRTAAFLIVGAGVVAALQWWQIIYRLYLFAHDYDHREGLNHVEDGTFMLLHGGNLMLVICVLSARLALRM